MKKLISLVIFSLIFGFAFAQPILYQEKVVPHALGYRVFPHGNNEYDMVAGYIQNGITMVRLSSQFDSLWGRASILTVSPQEVLPSLDSGFFISGLSRGAPGWRASGGLMSPSGYAMWQANSAYSGYLSYGRGSMITADSNYLVVGVADSGGTQRNLLLTKINRTGQVVWESTFFRVIQSFNVVEISGGFLVLTSALSPQSSLTCVQVDFNGNLVNSFQLPDQLSELPLKLIKTGINRFVSVSYIANSGWMHLICHDSLGTIIWDRVYPNLRPGNHSFASYQPKVAVASANNNLLVLGNFSWQDTTQSTDGIVQLMVEIDSMGDVVWTGEYGTNQPLDGRGLTALSDGRILALSVGNVPNSHDEFYSLIAEFGPDTTTSIQTVHNDFAFHLQPQPVTDILEVSLNLPQPGDLAFTLIDLQGRTVLRQNREAILGDNRFSLDMGSFPAGVYVLRVESNGRAAVQKVVKK